MYLYNGQKIIKTIIMDRKKIIEIAFCIDPIMHSRSPLDARPERRHWILLKPHKATNILGKCMAQAITCVRGGFGEEWGEGSIEHILISDRNVITISEQISNTDDEAFIRKLLQHEIEHAKQSENYMDDYKRR